MQCLYKGRYYHRVIDDSGIDPTEQSRWCPLRLLPDAMDADIARLYTEARVDGVKPGFVLELIRLHHHSPMTITELAASVRRTHSALRRKSFHDRIAENLAEDAAWG